MNGLVKEEAADMEEDVQPDVKPEGLVSYQALCPHAQHLSLARGRGNNIYYQLIWIGFTCLYRAKNLLQNAKPILLGCSHKPEF